MSSTRVAVVFKFAEFPGEEMEGQASLSDGLHNRPGRRIEQGEGLRGLKPFPYLVHAFSPVWTCLRHSGGTSPRK